MSDSELLFERAPAVDGSLVFGETDAPVAPAAIPGRLRATLLSLRMSAKAKYVSGADRPLVAQAIARFQDAVAQPAGVAEHWQDSNRLPAAVQARYQDGASSGTTATIGWRDAQRLGRDGVWVGYQDALRRRLGTSFSFAEAMRQRVARSVRYQDGQKQRLSTGIRYQEAIRGMAGQSRQRYQDALPVAIRIQARNNDARQANRDWRSRYQDGVQPRPGISDLNPVLPPLPEPCYKPDPFLLFQYPPLEFPALVFFCDGDTDVPVEPPGATIVVPVKEIYIVINDVTLRRVDGNVLLPTFSMSLSLDAESWTWNFSASLPGRALPDLEPSSDGEPVEVQANINGVPYRFLIEQLSRERVFAKDGLRIGGRGVLALLDEPYAPSMSFGNATSRSARQLVDDVLTINGVSMGWDIDWQLDDWQVPGNQWKLSGSYIAALNAIAGAAGGYVQPTPAAQGLRILPRYPALPWDWADVVPDLELPAEAVTRESIEWREKARYNRVIVAGQGSAGRVGRVTRQGTAGDLPAPMVTDALITDPIAARQRGASILANTGRMANISLRTAVGLRDSDEAQVGVITPGKFIRYVDNGVVRLGITRSVSVEISGATAWQTFGVESHESL